MALPADASASALTTVDESVADLFATVRRRGLRSADGRHAADRLIRLLGPYVLSLCMRRAPSRSVAEDLFQEAFLRLLLQAEAGTLPESVGNYVAGIVRNLSAHYWRDQARIDASAQVDQSDLGGAERAIVARLDAEVALSYLPARMRAVLYASLIEGSSTADIAQELGITEENARQLKSRGLRILAELRPGLTGFGRDK